MAVQAPARSPVETRGRFLGTPLRFTGWLSGQVSLEEIEAEMRAEVTQRGKFTKVEAVYFPLAPVPPLGFVYQCATCRFFRRQQGQTEGTCEVVEGTIAPYAWTPLWLPNSEDRLGGWLTRPLAGE